MVSVNAVYTARQTNSYEIRFPYGTPVALDRLVIAAARRAVKEYYKRGVGDPAQSERSERSSRRD